MISPILILIVLFMITLCDGDFLASSSIQQCTQTDTDNLACSQKMVVTLALDGGMNGTEALQALLSTATDGSQVKTLKYPWKISLSKSPIQVAYPVTYLQTVNNKPTEVVIYTTDYIVFDECDAGSLSSNPTCGWYKDSQGHNVPYSQGYCCACSLAQDLGISTQGTRSGEACALFGSQSSSAHCLQFDDLWYNVFEIGNWEIFYTITLTIDKYDESTSSYVEELITLSPSSPGTTSQDGSIVARLIGDFSPPQQYSVFNDKYLAAPSSPVTDPRVEAGSTYWMLLDKELFDLSGNECNKIGTSFYAFTTEPNACLSLQGSCLNGQLDDYYNTDIQKRISGQVGEYFVDNWGSWVPIKVDGIIYLAFYQTSIQASVITLTFSADDIEFIINSSPGVIVAAYVDTFEALSKNGLLHAIIENTGTIQSDYTVTVTDCSTGILAIQAQKLTIGVDQSMPFDFQVYSQTPLQASYQCTVTLLDSMETVQDTRIVYFNTTATNFTKGAQGGDSPDNNAQLGGNSAVTLNTCDSQCPVIFDLPCFILKQCWGNIAKLVALVIGVAIALIIVFKFCTVNRVMRVLCCCCRRRRDGGDSPAKKYRSSSPSPPSSPPLPLVRTASHSKWRPLSIEELELIVLEGIPVYFCVTNGNVSDSLDSPGSNYSLIGSLRQPDDRYFEFSIEPNVYQTLYMDTKGRYKRLNPPRHLDEEFFSAELDVDLARRHLSTRSPVSHPCLNRYYH